MTPVRFRSTRRALWTLACVFLLIVVAVVAVHPYTHALLRSKDHFIVHASSPRVFYEPGAEEEAGHIALLLPEAVKTIEDFHAMPFQEEFHVYVCASQESHNAYNATPPTVPIRGMALRGDVFIAPSAFSFHGLDTHRETLLHELAHLHLAQRLGFFERNRLPIWFREGEADVIAGSGGEGIETEDAAEAILSGRHFALKRDSGLFDTIGEEAADIGPRMFHQQSRMFTSFLRHYRPEAFTTILLGIQKGDSFIVSFEKGYAQSLEQMWNRFLSSLSHG